MRKSETPKVALIFAGGTGQRMNTKTRPKQFLELHQKPIIVYTIEQFENHPDIDAVVVVCIKAWIPFLREVIKKFALSSVADVVAGGKSGQASIRNGLERIIELYGQDAVVFVHDGVRPLVDEKTISKCIKSVAEYGNAITVVPATETIIRESEGKIIDIIDRQSCHLARAPQCFYAGDLAHAHAQAQKDGCAEFIDSASLMRHYGYSLHCVQGNIENIKITTPSDFYIFRAIVDVRENAQIFGL